jgi:hypothetical protein
MSEINRNNRIKEILKKGIVFAGAVTRSLLGIGAVALIFLSLKKKKRKD